MTFINGFPFNGHNRYKIERIIEILKENNRYYRCRVCKKQYVKKEGKLCESCRHLADLEYKGKNRI